MKSLTVHPQADLVPRIHVLNQDTGTYVLRKRTGSYHLLCDLNSPSKRYLSRIDCCHYSTYYAHLYNKESHRNTAFFFTGPAVVHIYPGTVLFPKRKSLPRLMIEHMLAKTDGIFVYHLMLKYQLNIHIL